MATEQPDAPAPGKWSRRIQVRQTGSEVVVTGTRFQGDPPQVRATLKARPNRFDWKPDRGDEGEWVFRHRDPARLRQAADGVRQMLAKLDQADVSFPPTKQQQAIKDAVVAGAATTAVHALAGTGKTTTMIQVAEALPDKNINYLAFNRSIADEAEEKMPRNVTSMTSHAMAKRALRGGPLTQKLDWVQKGGARYAEEIASVLQIEPVTIGEATYEAAALARLAMAAVDDYRVSAAAELGPANLSLAVQRDRALASLVLRHARAIWEDICDPDSRRIIFTHDDYRKIWIETEPVIDCDLLIFDEAQDINPVLRKLVQSQPMQKIVVGDSYQSIYGFTGAIDALATWPADVVLPLTQSWRFGPRIADVGNAFLRLLDADMELQGNPGLDTQLGLVDDPDVVLTRSNAGAVAAVVEAMDEGKRVALVGGGKAIEDIAKAAKELQNGNPTTHPELARFRNWNEVVDAVETDPEAEPLQMFVRLIDRYTPDGLLRMVADLAPETSRDPETRPQLVVSTAHKAKGREWDKVRIGGDFPRPYLEDGKVVLPPAEEIRLAYVTVTRAKRELEIGPLDWIYNPAAAAYDKDRSPQNRDRASDLVAAADEGPVLVAERPLAATPTTGSDAEQADQVRTAGPVQPIEPEPARLPRDIAPVAPQELDDLPPEPDLPPDPFFEPEPATDPVGAGLPAEPAAAEQVVDQGDAGVGPKEATPDGAGAPKEEPMSEPTVATLVSAAAHDLNQDEIIEGLRQIGAPEVEQAAARAFALIDTGTGQSAPGDVERAVTVFGELQQAVDRAYPRLAGRGDGAHAWMDDAHREMLWRASAPEVGYPYLDRQELARRSQPEAPAAPEAGDPATSQSYASRSATITADGPSDEDLLRSYEDLLAVFSERGQRDLDSEDPVPAGAYASPEAERLARAFEQLTRAVADEPRGAPVFAAINAAAAREAAARDEQARPPEPPPTASGPALAPGLEPLHDALAAAHARASWYNDTPQGQQIRAVTAAVQNLTDAIAAAPRHYLDELAQDVRVRGFLQTVTARASRVIANASGAIATGMERLGLIDTPAWLAMKTLHTRSADLCDQLMGELPPGWTLQTLDGLSQRWTSLRARLNHGTTPNTTPTGTPPPKRGGPETTTDTPIGRAAADQLRTAIAAAGQAAGSRVTGSRAWQRLTDSWDQALPVLSQLHDGVLRFEDDAAELGPLRAAWIRTCELASATARRAMDRVESTSPDTQGAGWHALRLVRHVSEQSIARLRGDLPPGQLAPLGTYDHQTASRPTAQAPAVSTTFEGQPAEPAATTSPAPERPATSPPGPSTAEPQAGQPAATSAPPQPAPHTDAELLNQAVELVVTTQHGTASLLEHRLPVSQAQASALMDQMRAHGIVGPGEGGNVRDVLVAPGDLTKVLAKLRSSTAEGPARSAAAPAAAVAAHAFPQTVGQQLKAAKKKGPDGPTATPSGAGPSARPTTTAPAPQGRGD